MTILQKFPLLNQNSDTREVNAAWDCVPTCVACGLIYFTDKAFDPGAIKDAVYGKSYRGGTDAARYVSYCAAQGVTLYQITGSPTQLIANVHSLLTGGLPAIITIPDPYMSAGSGYTHVDIFHQDNPGSLTALDPYIGQDKTYSDAQWASLLVGNMLWVMKGKVPMPNGVPNGWTLSSDGKTLYSPNNKQGGPPVPITGPFMQYILNHAWDGANVALDIGYHTSGLELSNPALGGGWQQVFRFSVLGMPDTGAYAGKVIYEWYGLEILYLRQIYLNSQTELDALKQQFASLTTQLQQANAQVVTEQEQIKTLQAELASNPGSNAVANRLQAIILTLKPAIDSIGQAEVLAAQPF